MDRRDAVQIAVGRLRQRVSGRGSGVRVVEAQRVKRWLSPDYYAVRARAWDPAQTDEYVVRVRIDDRSVADVELLEADV